ncbi:MAG: alpha/beta hydrolase [Planctomycetota bacterium]
MTNDSTQPTTEPPDEPDAQSVLQLSSVASDGVIQRRLFDVTSRDGLRIAAVRHTKISGALRPDIVVIVHGWSGDRTGPADILRQLADSLAADGTDCIRFDLLGRGESDDPLSGAPTLDGMINDTLDVISHIDKAFDADPQNDGKTQERPPLHLIGLCSGGNVALGAASFLKPRVKTVVGLSVLPFQEHTDDRLSGARAKRHRQAVWKKLFQATTWKKLITGGIDYKRVLRGFSGKETGTQAKPSAAADKASESAERNPKRSARDIISELSDWRGRLNLIYSEYDKEGAVAAVVFQSVLRGLPLSLNVSTIPDTDHNFYSVRAHQAIAELIKPIVNQR